MKATRLRLLLALGLLQPGCSFFCYGLDNLVEEPIDARDDLLMECRFSRMAEEAWQKVVADDPSPQYSYHYACGFKSGFVDYLDAGGTGDPPAAPPWIYRTAAFETPEGQQDVRDWFAGFRHGAAAAKASGYREAAVVLPIALPPYQPYGRLPAAAGPPAPIPAAAGPPAPKPAAPPEVLPPPRPLMPKADEPKGGPGGGAPPAGER
jgi:hypothetical protein